MAAKVLIFISTAWVVANNVPVVCADEVPVMDFCHAEDADADVAFLFQKKLRTTEAQDVSPNLWQPTDGASNVALDFLDVDFFDAGANLLTCDEKFDGNGANYRGCQDHTTSGFECQKWTSQSPHVHDNDGRMSRHKPDHNYCRNPGRADRVAGMRASGNEDFIWCYTTSAGTRWDYCEPKMSCRQYMSGNGANYRGCQDRTKNGFECQKWTSQSPHTHSRTPTNWRYDHTGLGDHNYCRNPDGESSIWCYTTNAGKRWDWCDLSCNEYMVARGEDYRGCQDRTKNGFECQKWTSQSPHTHSRTPTNKPHAGLGDHNYCRNPDGEPSIWCYTTDANKRWDFCNPRLA